MAATKSTILTNLDASPPSLMTPQNAGIVRRIFGTVTAAGTELSATPDTLRYFRVESSWIFVGIRMIWADLSATADMAFGLWEIDGGAVVDQNCFVTTVDIATAGRYPADGADVWEVVPAVGVANTNIPIWEIAGETTDPNKQWDMCGAVLPAILTIAATRAVELLYIDPAA